MYLFGEKAMIERYTTVSIPMGNSSKTFAKRFNVNSITRDKPYNVGKNDKSKVQYFSANPNGEAELVTVYLHGLRQSQKESL